MGHKYLIGSMEDADFDTWVKNMNQMNDDKPNKPDDGLPIGMILVVILAIIAGYYFYSQQS